jgi:serine/threonine protein kinase
VVAVKQDPDLLTLDETAILRFERFWIQGRPEPIDHFLPNLESRHYLPTLEELVHIEMEFLWKRCSESSTRRSPCDAPPSVEAYLRRFSALDQPIVVQRLVQQEYSLRSQYDHRSAFEEYCRRSPNLATILGKANPDATANRDLTFNERVSRRALQAPDGFELLGQLGQGGMGLVYRARDLQLDREVALKFIKPVFAADSTTCARFVEEARITGRLQHPGIPPVYQVGQLPDGRPFLAMKLIEGRTLQDLLANGAALPNRLAVFEAICQAVGFAHSRNVIHRDLKPQNVMVGSFGEVQVMDWGLAKDLSTKRLASTPPYAQETLVASIETSLNSVGYFTHAGSILGTPAFMPPEQAGGEIDRIDQRADVFALGAILCVVITGEPPYTGPTHDAVILAAVRGALQGAHARLEASGAEPELVALAKSCLMFEPEDRPADASVLATEVARLRAAAEERARTAELERVKAELRAAELRKRRKVQLSLAASVLLLLAGVGAFGWWFDHQRQEAERRSEAESQRHLRNAQAIEIALERSEQAMRVDDALRAAVALEQAENRIAEGGGEHLHARLERCRRDLRILALLNQADERHWTVTENRIPNLEEATTQWMTAFKEYGIIAGESTSSDAAEMIQASLIRDRIVAALDNCLLYRPTKGCCRSSIGKRPRTPFAKPCEKRFEQTITINCGRWRSSLKQRTNRRDLQSFLAASTRFRWTNACAICSQCCSEVLEICLFSWNWLVFTR